MDNNSSVPEKVGGYSKGISAASYFPGRYTIMLKDGLSKSTKFGFKDTVKRAWAWRVDSPHKGANFPHINVNPKVSGVRDPHLRLPPGADAVASATTKTLKYANDAAIYAAVASDAYKLGKAVSEDYSSMKTGEESLPKNTVVAGGSIAGGWTGAVVGASLGSKAGGIIALGFGCLGGGAVAVVAQSVVCAIGGIAGSIYGHNYGSSYGEEAAKKFTKSP